MVALQLSPVHLPPNRCALTILHLKGHKKSLCIDGSLHAQRTVYNTIVAVNPLQRAFEEFLSFPVKAMVDVLVRVGGPKSRSPHQTEIASLNPSFITSSPSMPPKRRAPALDWKFVQNCPSPILPFTSSLSPPSHSSSNSRHPKLARTSRSRDSRRMSHTSLSMNHHLFNEEMACVGKIEDLNQAFGLLPNTMDDSPMKRSVSSSTASLSDEQVPDAGCSRYPGATYRDDVKHMYPISAGSSDWRNMSVIAEAEDVPSLSSSFEFSQEEEVNYQQIYPYLNQSQLGRDAASSPFDTKPVISDSRNGEVFQGFLPSEYYTSDPAYFLQAIADEQQPKYYQTGNSTSWDNSAWKSQSVTFADYLSMPSGPATQSSSNYLPLNAHSPHANYQTNNFEDYTRRGNPGHPFTSDEKAPYIAADDTAIQSPFSITSSVPSQDSLQESSSDLGCADPSNERNIFLIRSKNSGLSYKEIKRRGGFREAESTLRGRYRTLTKAKEHRVRKPKWHARDVSLHSQPEST